MDIFNISGRKLFWGNGLTEWFLLGISIVLTITTKRLYWLALTIIWLENFGFYIMPLICCDEEEDCWN